MKTKLLLLLVLLAAVSRAQITVSHSDFQQALNPGVKFSSWAIPPNDFLMVYVGHPSNTAQYWNFTNYPYEHVGLSNTINPSAAPFTAAFPGTNNVIHGKTFNIVPDTMYNYTYHNLMADRLLLYGMSDDTMIMLTYDPPALQFMIPVAMGNSWVRGWDSTYIMPNYYVLTTSTVTVDAFGNMELPTGVYPCLRLRQDNIGISHTPFGVDTSYTRDYHFFTEDLTEMHIMGILEENFNLDSVPVNSMTFSAATGQSGLPDEPAVPSLTLDPIKPNPASDHTRISFHLSSLHDISLAIYDVAGRRCRTLLEGQPLTGDCELTLSVAEIPDGLYFCRLTAGKYTVTRKLAVSK